VAVAAVGAAAAAAVFRRLRRRAVAAAVGAAAVGAASAGAAAVGTAVAGVAVVGVAVVGMAVVGVVGNLRIKLAAAGNSSSIVGNAPSAPGHGSPPEEFAYRSKQMGPHAAAPSPEASMLIDEQLQVIMVIVPRM